MLIINSEEKLGRGGFGVVLGGLWLNKKVAVKTIKLDNLATDIRDGEMALKHLNHPNVIKLIHVENSKGDRCYVLERCEASLDKLFFKDGNPKKYCGPMPPKIDVLLQLGRGLDYIHKMKLIHRDITPKNVLIWVDPEESGTPQVLMKWADFGLSKSVNERGSHSVSAEIKGTAKWLAPETMKMIGDDVNLAEERRGTIKSDVFAEGLVFGYFLLKGIHPFSSDTLKVELNIRENKPENLKNIKSKGVLDIIKTMLENQPEKRVSSEETVQKLNDLEKKLHKKEQKLIRICVGEKPNLKVIQSLIQDIINVNCKNPQGSTPLLLLLSRNNFEGSLLETVKLFTECDADVNYVDRDGRNGLHYLCKNYQQEDFIQIIQLFIDKGIDLNCIDSYNQTALDLLNQFNAKHRSVDEARRLLSNVGVENMDE